MAETQGEEEEEETNVAIERVTQPDNCEISPEVLFKVQKNLPVSDCRFYSYRKSSFGLFSD